MCQKPESHNYVIAMALRITPNIQLSNSLHNTISTATPDAKSPPSTRTPARMLQSSDEAITPIPSGRVHILDNCKTVTQTESRADFLLASTPHFGLAKMSEIIGGIINGNAGGAQSKVGTTVQTFAISLAAGFVLFGVQFVYFLLARNYLWAKRI